MIGIKIPGLKVNLGNTRKRRRRSSRRHSKKRNRFPDGNWIETAKNIKIVKRNLLQAKLKNRRGFYSLASTYFRKGDIFENIDGTFVLVSSKYDSVKSRNTFNSKYYTRYHHRKYSKDAFNVYFDGKQTSINVLSFEDLGHGYARDAFAVYYKGKKIEGAFHLKFQVLGRDYAKDPFNVYKRGKKIPNANPNTFTIF